MPVKDSIESTEQALRALTASEIKEDYLVRVYNDNSTVENTQRLEALCRELGVEHILLSSLIDTPSPNYLFVLRREQHLCVAEQADLLIVESDVIVRPDTLQGLVSGARRQADCGLAAAVTVDDAGKINYPYEYAARYNGDVADCPRHLSFCCTLLSQRLLRSFDFGELDDRKSWFDVTISHASRRLGFKNMLFVSLPVVHHPHQSRPWKLLKKQNPLLYYWRKWTCGLDKI